jgi:phage anti-repressor protein
MRPFTAELGAPGPVTFLAGPCARDPAHKPGTIGGDLVQTVNASKLHSFLGIGKDFSTWINERITKFEFVENQDSVIVDDLRSPNSGSAKARTQIFREHHLTLDMAKELSMVEWNEKGKEARLHFIECERKLKAAVPAPVDTTIPNAILPRSSDETAPMILMEQAMGIDAFTVSRSGKRLIVEHREGHEYEYSFPADGRRVLSDESFTPAAARLSNEQLLKAGLSLLDPEQSFLDAETHSGDARRAAEKFLSEQLP